MGKIGLSKETEQILLQARREAMSLGHSQVGNAPAFSAIGQQGISIPGQIFHVIKSPLPDAGIVVIATEHIGHMPLCKGGSHCRKHPRHLTVGMRPRSGDGAWHGSAFDMPPAHC